MSKQSDAKAAQGGPIIKFLLLFDEIKPIEVLRETESSVVLAATGYGSKNGERREAKMTDWRSYHDTWAEAHECLQEKAEREATAAREAFDKAQAKLMTIMSMRPPKD